MGTFARTNERMPKFRFINLLVLSASIAFSHANLSAGVSTAATKPAAAKSTVPRLSDADLGRAIKARFARSKINADKFTATVQGGVATLEGHTDVVQHKGTATRLAKSAGALAVVNNIGISQAAKDKAMANLESGRRRAQVKRSDTPEPRTQQ